MLPGYTRKTNIGVSLALLMLVAATLMRETNSIFNGEGKLSKKYLPFLYSQSVRFN